jgi:hypothetical protein
MNVAQKSARAAGAAVLVDKFKDSIVLDAAIQWPSGTLL